MLALANSVCFLALTSGVYTKEKALRSTAPQAGNDTAQHRTALRRIVELAKLNGALLCFFALSAVRSCVTRKKNLSPYLRKAIRCAHVLP